MIRLNIWEELKIVFNMIGQSKYFLITLILFLGLGIILSFINQKNKKTYQILYIALLIGVIVWIGIHYYDNIGKMFQYMMNQFFIIFYFPNLAIYLAGIIVLHIILWISVLKVHSSKAIRLLNTVVFLIINYFLILILSTIKKEQLDVYSQSSIYQNDNMRSLIELSSVVFTTWVLFLIIYKIILNYLSRNNKAEKELELSTYNEKDYKNYQFLAAPITVKQNIKKKKKLEKEKIKEIEKEEEVFSIEDYKLFSEILKSQKNRRDNQKSNKYKAMDNKLSEQIFGNIHDIDISNKKEDKKDSIEKETIIKKEDNLEPQEEYEEYIIKEQWKNTEKEQEKLTELERLYQSIIY